MALYTTIWTPRDFADHFRCKIDTIRPNLLPDHNMFNNTTDPPEMEMESFVKVDTEMLGTVFSQVKQTTCPLDTSPTSLFQTFSGHSEDNLLNIASFFL